MNVFRKVFLATLVMSAAGNVFAANTADLTVKGVIKPVACTPSFVGGGVIDYGNIPPSTLSRTESTALARKEFNYTITCDAPITMATRWVDARLGTAGVASRDVAKFGLGKSGDAKIGAYILMEQSKDLLADGKPGDILFSKDKGATWVSTKDQYNLPDGSELVSYASPGSLIPNVYKTIAGKLWVQAHISPTAGFDFSKDIELDGLATLEVMYL